MDNAKEGTGSDDGGRYACDQSALWISSALGWLEAATVWTKAANAERAHTALEQATLCIARAGRPLCERLGCGQAPHGTIAKDAAALVFELIEISDAMKH